MKPPVPLPAQKKTFNLNALLLGTAWLAALAVYTPVTGAGWFYDDSDYVLADTRLNHLHLFLPNHWSVIPPPLENENDETYYLPGYGKPIIADRYVWRLSMALERALWKEADTPAVAHTINLAIHLACIAALFLALTRLVLLYSERTPASTNALNQWHLVPGVAALIFAVHPWAAEPVCYVSARNGSLGTFFALLGTGLWVSAFIEGRSHARRLIEIVLSLLCALAAVGSKENFVTVPAGYVLVVWPIVWQRLRQRRRGVWIAAATGAIAIAILITVAWLAIKSSERATGLWAQVFGGRGWAYFFNIQNPLVLMTLGDQLPVRRLSMEFDHPGWPAWACAVAMGVNAVLFIGSTLGGLRWLLLLALSWFFLHLIPTNSFLPRPDFLAGRNVYLPMAGIATLAAGGLLWIAQRVQTRSAPTPRRAPWIVYGAGTAVWIYWAVSAGIWARGFLEPKQVWARSAKVAPDHAAIRMNLALAIYNQTAAESTRPAVMAEAEREFLLAIAAENSPSMLYQEPRFAKTRSSIAYSTLGIMRTHSGALKEAERFFRLSWGIKPSKQAWVGWAYACLKVPLPIEDLLFEGIRQWPSAWWPPAVRGLYNAGNLAVLPDSVRADLERAENAPDENMVELRSVQALAIYRLTQSEPNSHTVEARLKRLLRLGLEIEQVKKLKRVVESHKSSVP